MKTHKNHLRLLILLLLVLLACVGYMTVGVHFDNQKLFAYAMRIRTPKLIAMLITAFAIGSASIVFQSIINNTIVTPCLLGMDRALFADPHGGVLCGGFGQLSGGQCQRSLCGRPCHYGRCCHRDLQLSVPENEPQRSVRPAHRHSADLVLFQHPDDLDPCDGTPTSTTRC